MSAESNHSFDVASNQLDAFANSRDLREQLLQYNLDQTLKVVKFRINGQMLNNATAAEYEEILKSLFSDNSVLDAIEARGIAELPIRLSFDALGMSVTTLDFFDRLSQTGIVGPGGRIHGCFDETYDGITVGDLLREMLLNEDSENASTYTDSERKELIFQIFRLFAVGGSLCQPETNIDKYLGITKAVYKEIVTVYKQSESNEIKVSGKSFKINKVNGIDFHPSNSDSPHNVMIVVIDPLKHSAIIIKNTFKNFW